MERCITVHYQCLQCGAFDSDRFRPDEHVPAMINCIKCHAGRDKDQAGMRTHQVGMRALSMDEAIRLRPEAFPELRSSNPKLAKAPQSISAN